jgi:HK97 family phage prohead protease
MPELKPRATDIVVRRVPQRAGSRQRQPPPVDEDESRDDYMDRCIAVLTGEGYDEAEAQEACALEWDEDTGGTSEEAGRAPITKATVAHVRNFEFTLSDETPDRYGDVVSAGGWELDNFRKNPIALFGHDYHFPIGRWLDLHVENKALRGHLELAPKGSSARIDEIRSLIDADILRAVSVGFRPTVSPEPLKDGKGEDTGGVRFLRQELLECSVVPIPANPNALAIAKALNVSSDTLKLVFAVSGDRRQLLPRRSLTGVPAATSRSTRRLTMATYAERIESTEQRINTLEDERDEHLRNVDDSNPSEADDTRTSELTRQIAQLVRHRSTLIEAQAARAPGGQTTHTAGEGDADPAQRTSGSRALVPLARGQGAGDPIGVVRRLDGSTRFVQRMPARKRKELDPVDYLVRNGVITLFAHRQKKNPDDVRRAIYGEDEYTKAAFQYIQRAPVAPAMTTVDNWAAELVTQINGDFMAPLMPRAVFPAFAALGLALDFGRAGRIAIPTRLRPPTPLGRTIAGSFIGEGQPIPVRQAAFGAVILTPKKLGVITVMTREIDEHSIPAIEALLRDAISEDTGQSIDSILLDTNPADTVRPAGIRWNITPIVATTVAAQADPFRRLVMDTRLLRAALIESTYGNVRSPVWIMNPIRADSIALTPATGVDAFPFRNEVRAGTFEGWPVLESTIIADDQMIAVDAADFVTVGQGAPVFEVSDQATLHMEDTEPQPIVGGGTPDPGGGASTGGTPATPVRSMWQTDSYALRMLYRLNWTLRRPMVAWMQGLTW